MQGSLQQAGGKPSRPGIKSYWLRKTNCFSFLVGYVIGLLLVVYVFALPRADGSMDLMMTFWEGRVFAFTVLPLFWGGLIGLALNVALILFGFIWREVVALADPQIRLIRRNVGRLPTGADANSGTGPAGPRGGEGCHQLTSPRPAAGGGSSITDAPGPQVPQADGGGR